ncbi:MAG TPA: hypothetical protein VLN59_00410 [Burkholderiales bacterium]|nr:hypothetical protein [Burkholderiales bacterium]
MEHHISVNFADDREYDFHLYERDTAGIAWEQAQAWIDEEYVNTAYESSDPVGTALLAEKIVRIAMAYGPQPFANNTAWAKQFVRCAGRALGKVKITVDVSRQRVGD